MFETISAAAAAGRDNPEGIADAQIEGITRFSEKARSARLIRCRCRQAGDAVSSDQKVAAGYLFKIGKNLRDVLAASYSAPRRT